MAKLRREISLFTATLYGVGIILGAGIYVLIGETAGVAGNSFWLAFVAAAIIAAFTGLSYAELSSMFPKNAAEYVYTKKAFKRNYLSFIVQWIMIFTLIASAATVALGFGGYFSFLFGGAPIAAALVLVVILSLINYIGIKESTRFNILSTIVEMGGLVLVAILGLFFLGRTEIDYFASPGGTASILSATALIFFAYIGFEELVNLSEETKNASKVIPKALISALVISTILYILVAIASLNILGAGALAASAAPLTEVVSAAIPQAGILMSLIALFATANTALVILIVVSRMLYGLSCNTMLPRIFGRVGRRGTPAFSVAASMLAALAMLFVGGVKTIALLTDIGIFIVYVFVNAALIWLRYKEPEIKRGFRSPLNIGKFPVLALLGILSSGLMVFYFEPVLIVYEIIVVLIGFTVYRVFARIRRERAACYPLLRKSIFTSREIHLIQQSIMYPMKVSSVMVKSVRTVKANDTVRKAVSIMNKNKIGSVVIVDKKRVAGILTERDVLQRVVGRNRPTSLPVKKVMSRPVKTISSDERVVDAISIMTKHNIKKLPVIKDGKLAGIVTATDIMKSGEKLEYVALKKLAQFFPVYRPARAAG